jgi:hypothetical protein
MKLKAWHKRTVISIAALITTVAILLNNKTPPDSTDETEFYRAKWTAQGSPNYSITVIFFWLPEQTRDRVLVFRDNAYASQGPDPDCKLPADWCAQPLSHPEFYGIDRLFREAQQCTDNTKAAYRQCKGTMASGFHGFVTVEALVQFGLSCGPVLSSSTSWCAVEYEPIYGYPRSITWYIPNAMDNAGGFEITKFQIDKVP